MIDTGQEVQPRIVKLDPAIVNRIAAGEVIERPAAVIKELGENSLDAGARRIEVELEQGGKRLIRLRDDGEGMTAEELPLALASHATSKLAATSDLVHIASFGFRGEALASMASIAELTVRSRPRAQQHGAELTARFGELEQVKPCGCPLGTEITVRELFATTPARLKFMKGASAELSHVVTALERLALPHPGVAFSLRHENRLVFELPPASEPTERIVQFWGPACAEALRELSYCEPGLRIEGQIATPAYTRPNASRIVLFVNGRHIRDRSLIAAVREAYREYLPSGRYPAAVLSIELPLEAYDVNVHPQKLEVRFREPRRLFARLKTAIRERLMQGGAPPRLALYEQTSPPGEPEEPPGETAGSNEPPNKPPLAPPHEGSALLARILAQEPTRHHSSAPPAPPAPATQAQPESPAPPSGPAAAAGKSPPSETRHTTAAFPPTMGGSPAGDGPSARLTPQPQAGSHLDSQRIVGLLANLGGERAAPPPRPGGFTEGLRNLFQVGQRYLVLEYGDSLAIVDQHALHERVLFAQFETRFRERGLERQRLLLPLPLDLSRAEVATLGEPNIAAALQRLGFALEQPETNSAPPSPEEQPQARLTAVPALLARKLSMPQIQWIVEASLHELREAAEHLAEAGERTAQAPPEMAEGGASEGLALGLPDVARQVIATLACKAAIKAGEALHEEEALGLLAEADQLEVAATCPHGRPTTLQLSFEQLDQVFGR